ncbi:MAG: tripartite tricarboxylate transporter substrate binding protein [Candidatus Methylomirabilales bacterium]
MRNQRMTRYLALLVGAVLAAGPWASAWAAKMPKPAGFPERPITIIVPYGAGGGSDQLTRAMASALEKVVGVPVTVVNKPGGGGRAAIPDFMAAPADGYTLMEHIDDSATLYASGKIRENPAKDWVPLVIAQITFSQIYVRPDDARFKDWESFVSYAKANPRKVTIANVGAVGSMERVTMLQLEKAFGFKTTQVSFDKPAERYASLIGKHVDALFEQPGDVRRFLEAGEMKVILTIYPERPQAFAVVPSLTDIGLKWEPLLRWRGFFARKGVPGERLKYLEWAMGEAWKSTDFQAFNKKKFMHLINSYRNTGDARKLIGEAIQSYRNVYKEIGLIK